MESNQKIFDKIDELYNLKDENGNQKNKAFFSHLIRSYLPLKSVAVADKNPSKKVKVKCVFTQKELITLEKANADAGTDSMRKNIADFVSTFDQETGVFLTPTPMKQLFNGKILALQGKDTKTYMSQESYATFVSWVMLQYKNGGAEGKGDGHIRWLIHQMKGQQFHPAFQVETRKPKNKRPAQPKVYSTNSKGATFGDPSALQALKDKFKDSE